MFEILENLNVLHSQIGLEKDHSEVTIFKANLENYILFKPFNLILKIYNAYLTQLYFAYVYSDGWACLLNYYIFKVLFESLARIKCSIISLNQDYTVNFQMPLLFEYFLIFDLLSRSILYITRKGVEK